MSKAILISPQTKTTDKLRVAAYCRVSTNSQDQLNSYTTYTYPGKRLNQYPIC